MFIKKIIPSLFFLPLFGLFIYFANPFLQNYNLIFSLSLNDLLQIIYLTCFVLLTSLFFVIFLTLAQNYKIVLPIILISGAVPFILLPQPINIFLALGSVISFIIIFLLLSSDLKSYLTFSPTKILTPHIRNTSSVLILILTLVYFYGINQQITTKGFEIPDSLLNTALSFSGQNLSSGEAPKVDQTTIDQLKQDPKLLQQFGIDPNQLDKLNLSDLNQVTNSPLSSDSIKKQIKLQFQTIIKPYLIYMPYLLAVLFFITLSSFNGILSILIFPLVWFIFWLLDKSGYTKYEVGMREVRKLVI